MTDTVHVILDDTAMVAAGYGNILASRLISWAHTGSGWLLYAPVCALVEADRTRPGVAEHFAAMPAITVLELDLPAALAVARGATWAGAHTRYAAEPTPDRPGGAVIATAASDLWKGQPVRILDLEP
jgi:hypothetical protein